MPELPEVENMKMLLEPCLNKKITKCYSSFKKMRQPISQNIITSLEGNCVTKIERRAKYLIFYLSNNTFLVVHAGMSGKFIITLEKTINKHDHLILFLDGGDIIKFNDPRRFGLLLTFNSLEEIESDVLKNVAIDALSPDLTLEALYKKFKTIKKHIKATLLDQKIISGIGNIYASEILFYSKISPLKKTEELTKEEVNTILENTKMVLNKSISLGGSTLKDYARPNGEKGYFQNSFSVYNKENTECVNCGSLIKKIVQNNRATFYCESCQKNI